MSVCTQAKVNGLTGIEINNMPFTDNADALFDCRYTTRTLAYELANAISIRSDDASRVAYLAEYNEDSNSNPWIRGTICKALDMLGESVSRINRRRA